MAGILVAAQTAEISLTAATAKTVLQLEAAANHRVLIHEWSVSFQGTSNTDTPAIVQVLRQTSAGTMSSLTGQKLDPDASETIQTTLLHTATSEPTDSGAFMAQELIHPQTGMIYQFKYNTPLIVPGGGRLGIKITSPTFAGDCVARILLEE